MIIVRLLGGLGNQMFQYACGKSLSQRIKTKLVMDNRFLKTANSLVTSREYELNAFIVKTSLLDEIPFQQLPDEFTPVVETKHLVYNPPDLKQAGKNIYLSGHWQSWKYFQDINPLIRKRFCFTKQGFSNHNLQLSETLRESPSISIHIRRSDYTAPQYAYIDVLPVSYYQNAMQYIANHIAQPIFYIFSDDPEWAEANIKTSYKTYFIRNNTNIEDLYLMSQCKHNIIANSTYSWWGAWLNANPNKMVIAPKTWLIGINLKVDDIDIIPPGWISL